MLLYVLNCAIFCGHSLRLFTSILYNYLLTSDIESLFNNAHSHDEYLSQVPLKSLHKVQRYCVTRNKC